MVEIKREWAVYGVDRERLVFDLMKKFPIGPGNMSVIFTMEEAAATITVMGEQIARLTTDLVKVYSEKEMYRNELAQAYERVGEV